MIAKQINSTMTLWTKLVRVGEILISRLLILENKTIKLKTGNFRTKLHCYDVIFLKMLEQNVFKSSTKKYLMLLHKKSSRCVKRMKKSLSGTYKTLAFPHEPNLYKD